MQRSQSAPHQPLVPPAAAVAPASLTIPALGDRRRERAVSRSDVDADTAQSQPAAVDGVAPHDDVDGTVHVGSVLVADSAPHAGAQLNSGAIPAGSGAVASGLSRSPASGDDIGFNQVPLSPASGPIDLTSGSFGAGDDATHVVVGAAVGQSPSNASSGGSPQSPITVRSSTGTGSASGSASPQSPALVPSSGRASPATTLFSSPSEPASEDGNSDVSFSSGDGNGGTPTSTPMRGTFFTPAPMAPGVCAPDREHGTRVAPINLACSS